MFLLPLFFFRIFVYVPTCNAVAACNLIACRGLVVVLLRLRVFSFAPCNAVAVCNSMACQSLVVLSRFCVVPFATCDAVAACNLMTDCRLLRVVLVAFASSLDELPFATLLSLVIYWWHFDRVCKRCWCNLRSGSISVSRGTIRFHVAVSRGRSSCVRCHIWVSIRRP